MTREGGDEPGEASMKVQELVKLVDVLRDAANSLDEGAVTVTNLETAAAMRRTASAIRELGLEVAVQLLALPRKSS
jgi:hypothetical protein